SADLNPYSSLVSSDVVKNKIFTNKLFSKTEHNNYFIVRYHLCKFMGHWLEFKHSNQKLIYFTILAWWQYKY
ncbi:hypothetical protein, partial [Mycoplasmopsis bovis]|uniref:hypothetical protein n=1 Tax=Mycoplasmopsis bovis TaxID=28903 RepID=UPI003D275CA2